MGANTKSRQERGYGATWDKLRLKILRRDKFLCVTCLEDGRPVPASEVDHIQPKADGGTDKPSNLQSLCSPCHVEKTRQENKGINYSTAVGKDGWPVDKAHPANKGGGSDRSGGASVGPAGGNKKYKAS